MTHMNDLKGRIALVTGGGSGIGAACVALLAEAGARVVVADLDLAAAQRQADAIGATALTVDIASDASVEEMFAAVERQAGPIDIVVNSAGIAQMPRAPEDMRQSSWDKIVAVDLRGTWLVATQAGRRMARRGGGSIINIASIAGSMKGPLHAYGPAKAGVVMMTGNLAAEWGRSGVRVNSVSPGHTLTPFIREKIEAGARDAAPLEDFTALGRMVLPEEVAKAVLFLASDMASAITGVNLLVDCGASVTGGWRPYGWVPAARAQA
jgi:NAD(P)-dependent dehydrogenase (short-subunit alcohol dehydrogenase family)